ncbi:hypothetical protein HYS00_03885 [Candidatus Microgenomates bacterium]|nr:hypothetical protein [Candidatus Microgenomates bacterium]
MSDSITFHVKTHSPILMKPGDTVDFDTPLTKKTFSQQDTIALSDHLGIPPKSIFMHLHKVVGEPIKKHETLAEKKTMFGMKKFVSEYEGIIKEINHQDGTLVVETYSESAEVTYSHFKGTIESIESNMITLRVNKFKEYPLKEVSMDFGGKTMIVEDSIPLSTLTHDDVAGNVIITKAISPVEAVRLEVLDEAGTITLHEIAENTPHNCARLKNVSDWEEIAKSKLPYCIVDTQHNTMYLYE